MNIFTLLTKNSSHPIMNLSSLYPSLRGVNHGIIRPDDPITVQDVIDGVRRAAFFRESSASSSSGVKVAHTMKSRWQKIRRVMGISSKKLSSGIYEGCLEAFDFQRFVEDFLFNDCTMIYTLHHCLALIILIR